MGTPILPDEPKHCASCAKPLTRKRFSTGVLEDRGRFRLRRFCDLRCMGDAKIMDSPTLGALRSRAKRLQLTGATCTTCGTTTQLGLHHLDGNPANNAAENVTTLCASCHTRWHWMHGKQPWKARPTCRICERPSLRRGLCGMHWQRWKKHGDPLLLRGKRVSPSVSDRSSRTGLDGIAVPPSKRSGTPSSRRSRKSSDASS